MPAEAGTVTTAGMEVGMPTTAGREVGMPTAGRIMGTATVGTAAPN